MKWVADKAAVDSLRDDPDVVLIDARVSERYRGEVEPIDPKPGHIPGAMNFPFQEVLDLETGRFLTPEKLREAFGKIGATKTNQIICYCGSGITACTNIFALYMAGFNARLYEGSWSEWSKDPELPVAKA